MTRVESLLGRLNDGMYGNPRSTMSLHNHLDLSRRNELADAMTDAAEVPGATAEDIAVAGIMRVIPFSLNKFIAPAPAKNVKPIDSISKEEMKQQMHAREDLKDIFVGLDGHQKSGPADATRAWAGTKKVGGLGKQIGKPTP